MKARYLTLEFIITMQDIQMVQAENKLEIQANNAFKFTFMRHSLLATSEVRIKRKDIRELMFGGKLRVCTVLCQ